METNRTNSRNPFEHTARIGKELEDIFNHLKEDIQKVDDRQAKALFEVSAEVISGLRKAFTDFEKQEEPAWKNAESGKA